ncbi:MAG: LysR family transcriptional regulator [Gammaproteobacteria bacterium]|nr:LysR family transcriptional regulator [Gammaproteobacteria bacterium]
MNQIRYFLSVSQNRNFTHTACAINESQPALTSAIKKREEEFDGALFFRDCARCQLTPLGALVRPMFTSIY